MNPLDYVIDFFKRLFRGRVDSVIIDAKSKMMGTQYRAQSAVSSKFNKAIDGTVDKAKEKFKKKDADKK